MSYIVLVYICSFLWYKDRYVTCSLLFQHEFFINPMVFSAGLLLIFAVFFHKFWLFVCLLSVVMVFENFLVIWFLYSFLIIDSLKFKMCNCLCDSFWFYFSMQFSFLHIPSGKILFESMILLYGEGECYVVWCIVLLSKRMFMIHKLCISLSFRLTFESFFAYFPVILFCGWWIFFCFCLTVK